MYSIPCFGLHCPSSVTWLTNARLVANYVTDVQLYLCFLWNKYFEYCQFFYGKYKLKTLCCGRKVQYKLPQDHTNIVDVLRHSDPWSSFIMEIVRQVYLLDWKNSFSLEKNVEIEIFYIFITTLNIDCCKN